MYVRQTLMYVVVQLTICSSSFFLLDLGGKIDIGGFVRSAVEH